CAAARRTHDVVPVHRVAAHPGHAVAPLLGPLQAALESAHFPACIAQLTRHLAANATRRAQHQCHLSACHVPSPLNRIAMANSGSALHQKELPNTMQQLYISAWTTTWAGSSTVPFSVC